MAPPGGWDKHPGPAVGGGDDGSAAALAITWAGRSPNHPRAWRTDRQVTLKSKARSTSGKAIVDLEVQMRLGAMEASDQLTAQMAGPEANENLNDARDQAEAPDAVEDLN
jgi:hypothetical protein